MIDVGGFDPALLAEARTTWRDRAETEWRSMQIMARFLDDVFALGEPLDVCAEVVDAVSDELRHARLCMKLCAELGGPLAEAPDPRTPPDAPPEQRALATAISMLAINETLSVGYLRDLEARCTFEPVHAVLREIVADEEGHDDLGWSLVRRWLHGFGEAALPEWQRFAGAAVAKYRTWADDVLADVAERSLDAWPDTDRAQLGLFSRERQALVFEHTWRTEVAPRLLDLRLL